MGIPSENSHDCTLVFRQISISEIKFLPPGDKADIAGLRVSTRYKVCIVLKNHGYLLYRDADIKLSQGDVFTIFPGVPYSFHPDSMQPWTLLILVMEGKGCADVFSEMGITAQRPFVFGLSSNEAEKHIACVVKALDEGNSSFFVKAQGYFILDALEKQCLNNRTNAETETFENPVEQAVKYIKENYHNHIDVDMVCNFVGYSRSHFSRSFKGKIGMAISEYINHTRIQRAKYLLNNTELYVAEIAKIVGFSDPFYFSKSFKKYTGRSPSEYVERSGENQKGKE